MLLDEKPDYWGYLSARGFRQTNGGREAVGICPACNAKHERSLSVNLESGLWTCNRKNNCGQEGNWLTLLRLCGDAEVKAKVTMQPIAYLPPRRSATALKDDGRKFLHGRGLRDAVIDAWRVGQDGGALAWPVYDAAGNLVNVKSRAIAEKKFWNQKGTARWPIGVHRCDMAINGQRLIVCEGELDAMTLEQCGLRNVVSLPNGSGDQEWINLAWDWLLGFGEIVLATDADEAGRKAREEIARRLGHRWLLLSVTMPDGHKDANAALMAGVAPERIKAAITDAAEIKPGEIQWAEHWTEAVLEIDESPDRVTGLRSGIAKLDEMLKGFRTCEVTVWTGQSGHGKSTVLSQLVLNWLTFGQKSAIYSAELRPERYLNWMMKQATGKGYPNRTEKRRAMAWVGPRVAMIDKQGSIELPDLIACMEYMTCRYGIGQLIVDSLQFVNAGADELKAQKAIMQALVDFANRHRVHVHLVAHPRKAEHDGAEVGRSDIKGNVSIEQLAHNIITVVRGQHGTKMVVKKNREYGVLGDAWLMVDGDSKQVYDSAGMPDFWPWINAADDDIPEWS